MKPSDRIDLDFSFNLPELFAQDFAQTLIGLSRCNNANPRTWQSTEDEKQHLLLTLINNEKHWVTLIVYEDDKSTPLLAMICENPRSGSTYRLVVPKTSVLSFHEMPEHQLQQEPKPRIGFMEHASHV